MALTISIEADPVDQQPGPGHGSNATRTEVVGIYTASAILSFFFVVRFVSETKGKEVEEMRV